MNTRDQFGHYLLLKKLTEDAFGETFRAGKIGRQALERVVHLRVYNGPGLDPDRVAKTIQARGGLAQHLKSPNIANAVDSGQVRGVPYVAYDYLSGRTLAQLAEQAVKRGQPIPLDHALLISERIAAGLAVAQETRFNDERVTHGMLTPHQVMVSHEGELRLTGFEAAPALRASASHPVVKQAIGRYLAPEALSGQPAGKNDDIYSLAAILVEMLTGQPVPAMPPAGFGMMIDQAVIAADGGNIHPDLAALLKRSLCVREERVGDVVAWHKSLAKLMADGQYNPTTFNLAFYLHSLFRDEIERETQELETERTQAIQIPDQPTAAAAPVAPATAAPAPSPVRDAGPVRENTDILRERYGISETKGGSKKTGLIAAAIGGVAVLAVGGWFLFGRAKPAPAPAAEPLPTAEEVAAPVPAEPAGPTPDEIQAQIANMVAEQSKQLEASVKAQYDEQMKALQKQLEDARRAETERTATAPPTPAMQQRTVETLPSASAAARTAAATPTPAPAATQPAAANPPAAQPATQPATQPTSQPAAPAPAPAAATTPPTTAAPQVRVGELVTPGPGVVPPRVTRQPPLAYPPIARRMKKEATVTVSVLVDENGRAAEVKQVGAQAGLGMDEAAVDYARKCTYAPATKNGVKVKMWFDLRVAFTLGGG